MIELAFNDELYDGFAIDEAVKTYADYATTESLREPSKFVIRVTASQQAIDDGFDEQTICAELANYALGKTIEREGAATGPAPQASSDAGGAQ